ncbi:MAG: BatA and WFA domain-containing protein [bacterium]|nr:BatA and WFA domain-containing protein [bacterium]
MNWINPPLLGFLAAVGIPLLLYWLSRRKLPKIYFPTLRFLKDLEKKQYRRIQITQWLLIVLRMLAILCIVLAFARPLLTGAVPIGTYANSDWVVVLDRSASMKSYIGNVTAYDQCLQFLRMFLNSLEPNDQVTLFFADRVDTSQIFNNTILIRNALDGSSPLDIVDDLSFGLRRAEKHLQNSTSPYRAILVLTDGKGVEDTTVHIQQTALHYFLWQPPLVSKNNVAINQLKLAEPLLNAENGAKISFQVQSYGDDAQSVLIKVSVQSNGSSFQAVGEKTLELAGNSTVPIEWRVPLTNQGPWIIRCEHLFEDVFRSDNIGELYILATFHPSVSISGDLAEKNRLERLLQVNTIAVLPQYEHQALHIHAGKQPPIEPSSIWKMRLENGGRLWLIPSHQADILAWNRWLENLVPIQMKQYDFHLSGLYALDERDLKMLLTDWVKAPKGTTNGRWILQGDPATIRFQDGSPFWIDSPIQNGILRIQSVPITGTSFETEPIQVPLFVKGIQMLQRSESVPVSEAGYEVEVPYQYEFFSEWTSPSGKTLFSLNRKFLFTEIGFWKNDSNQVWSIVFPKSESEFTLRKRIGGIPKEKFNVLPDEYDGAIQAILRLRNGRELRTLLIGIALGILMVEGFLGRGLRSKSNA